VLLVIPFRVRKPADVATMPAACTAVDADATCQAIGELSTCTAGMPLTFLHAPSSAFASPHMRGKPMKPPSANAPDLWTHTRWLPGGRRSAHSCSCTCVLRMLDDVHCMRAAQHGRVATAHQDQTC
jgi:hypothetical protein